MNKLNMGSLKKYRYHFLVWALFIFYETVVIGLVSGEFGNPLTYAAHYALAISLFYGHAIYGMPWAMSSYRNSFWRVPLVFLLEISVFIFSSFFIDKLLIAGHFLSSSAPLKLSFLYCLRMLYRGIYFLGFATGYYFFVTYINEKRKTDKLERQWLNDIIYRQKSEQELTKAQNAFLQAQITPHFLFNTLDFIYHNIFTISPVAADTIIALSEIMRFAIDSDKMGDSILLEDEISQVENLLYLYRIKKNNGITVDLNVSEDTSGIKLIPLVLLTLVENIFKHGDIDSPKEKASIHIYVNNKQLVIETDNLVGYKKNHERTGFGLSNVQKRLKYAYGSDIEFTHGCDDFNRFKVALAIPLDELKGHGVLSASLKDSATVLLREDAGRNGRFD